MSLSAGILKGDIISAARLISMVEDDDPGAIKVLEELYPHTGRAYIIGVTGPPGSGKSTLIDGIIGYLRKEGKGIGIIAVDPSSPLSGGAILCDRVRMISHGEDEGVFIRSMAARGNPGGLAKATIEGVNIIDALGKDVILIETVGVGQSEVDIVKIAHTSIIVLTPDMGDDLQMIKSGIMEMGDIFVLNKGDMDGADRVFQDLRDVLTGGGNKDGWSPSLFKTEASMGIGIQELMEGIRVHKAYLDGSGDIGVVNKRRSEAEFVYLLREALLDFILNNMVKRETFTQIVDDIAERKRDPYRAVREVMAKFRRRVKSRG
ncbi:MAG: methylmalonyl Co-A mutase-associated GTPase MeaB, partial [Nitrospinae bacterium]|nr:methylmalonyl Co-A mutase-associated GTPase MeaB [Nitrospinota bacterium]